MLKMIVTRTICDLCHARGEGDVDAPGTHTISMDRQTVELDLCELDAKRLLGSLEDAFAIGRRPEGVKRYRRTKAEMALARAADGEQGGEQQSLLRYDCPASGCTTFYPTRALLRDHARRVHATTLNELEGGPPAQRVPCPEPGCTYVARAKQGLSSHLRSSHTTTTS